MGHWLSNLVVPSCDGLVQLAQQLGLTEVAALAPAPIQLPLQPASKGGGHGWEDCLLPASHNQTNPKTKVQAWLNNAK